MTTPIRITTRQTEELIRKWHRTNNTQQTLTIVNAVLWGVLSIAHIISGIMNPTFLLYWINAGLAFSVVVLNVLNIHSPHLFFPEMTTTVTFTDRDARIVMDKKGKVKSYSANWNKVRVHESSDCFYFQVNWRQMQIFRKEDLTDCAVEELSAFFAEKLGKRYVKL